MRTAIPKEISEMNDKTFPYLNYLKGEGFVLTSDAPPEIVKMREIVLKWFEEHNTDI